MVPICGTMADHRTKIDQLTPSSTPPMPIQLPIQPLDQPPSSEQLAQLAKDIKQWAAELGFQQAGIADVALDEHEQRLNRWLEAGYHGDMEYMERHGSKRSRPQELIEGTRRVISLRMDYLTEAPGQQRLALNSSERAYISRYTLGRDYHKLVRKRLTQLAERIQQRIGGYQYRAFVDSAPVLERALATTAGLGWIGKNTMLINPKAGSYFFLGEIYTDLPLPTDTPFSKNHCGSCTACLDICPTQAFVGPHVLDARRCISYLTIELKGSIPEELRPLMGNRVFGCDDCQLICPWNRFAHITEESDFVPRHGLDSAELARLFLWEEAEFLRNTEGSAIRRTGYEGWLRNLAVGLGNAPTSEAVVEALRQRQAHPSELIREHVAWALRQHPKPAAGPLS